DAGRAGGHVEHRRSHRALLVDAAVLLAEALAHLALVGRELVVPGRELRVGVGVGRRQRLGRGGVDVGLGRRIDGGGAATAVARDLLVAAGGDATGGLAAALVQFAAGHRGHPGVAVGTPGNAAVGVARTGAAVQFALARGRRRRGAVVRRDGLPAFQRADAPGALGHLGVERVVCRAVVVVARALEVVGRCDEVAVGDRGAVAQYLGRRRHSPK